MMTLRRIFAAFSLLCALYGALAAGPVYAQKTKAQLNTEIGTNFPDNNAGQITPLGLRQVTNDIVNSIMATAPVVSGNVACFSGTTGLLQDCGSSPRKLLIADTTFWRRSDGSNITCNGTANASSASAPNCAYRDWNPLYADITAIYDSGGKIVTLKSGTTDTSGFGLTMSTALAGGGALVIDLNGSNIAETFTKGIVNNVVLSGPGIGIQNSAGLGVGGNISSSGFACIQNSAPGILGIGTGISTGPCFDAAYESIQGATVALSAPVNSIGAGGSSFVLTATGGNFGFNGQKVNVRANQTYTLGTVSAQLTSSITANSATFDLNPAGAGGPFTITGPRYSVTGNSFIYTGGGGANFFPGSTAGALVSDSGGCYDSTCYGSLADGTPMLGSLLATSIAAPAAPAAGKVSLYSDSTAGTFQAINQGGNKTTMVYTQNAVANLFATGISAIGVLTTAQPAFSNLSGSATAAQMPAFTGDVSTSAGATVTTIGATKVTSAMLNSDVFSTAHSWPGQQTFVAPILGTPASGNGSNLTNIPTTALTGALPAANEPAHTGAVTNSAGSLNLLLAFFDPGSINNCTLTAAVSSNNLTIALKTAAGADPTAALPCTVSFRNVTPATGDFTAVAVTAATSVVFNSGSGFGAPSSSTPFRLWVTAWNNAGVVVIGASNQLNSSATNGDIASIDEGTAQSSTACSACATATAAQTFYTTAAQTTKAIRILGYMDWASGLATTGVWASPPTTIQLMGPGIKKPGDSVRRFFLSTTTATTDASGTFVATNIAKNFTKQSAANLVRLDADGTILSNAAAANLRLQFHRGNAACTTAIGVPVSWNGMVSGQLYTSINRWIDVPAASGSTTAQYTLCMNTVGATSVSFPFGANGGAVGLIEEIMGANDNEKFGIPEEKTA